MVRKLLASLLALGILGSLNACNTVAGAGQDLQSGGQAVEDTARDVQRTF